VAAGTSVLAERVACAAVFWARREDGEAIRRASAGLSVADHAQVVQMLTKGVLEDVSDAELLERMLVLGAKSRGRAHKVVRAEVKSAALAVAPPVTGSGTFTGYLATYGRDHEGDTILPGAMDESVAAVNSGGMVWHLTDAHSEKASDVVATVTRAALDQQGLRIAGVWARRKPARRCGRWSATGRSSACPSTT
jgi:hypothetical protein